VTATEQDDLCFKKEAQGKAAQDYVNSCFNTVFGRQEQKKRLAPGQGVLYIVIIKTLQIGENSMHCPNCNTKKGIEIDMHSDGYAKDLFECSTCGTLWLLKADQVITVNKEAA